MKKCAIYLPIYNGEKFLKQTIDSVLNQSYKEFDLIIYNDGSTDNSSSIVSEYTDKRINFIDNRTNCGAGHAFYHMFKDYNDYEYIGMLGQDDVLDQGYLESQINTLEDSNNIVSFSKIEYIDDNNNRIVCNMYHHDILDTSSNYELLFVLLNGNHFCASSALIKNKAINTSRCLMSFNNDRLQDHELWLNLVIKGNFIYNQNTSILYRKHNTNLSNPNKRIRQNKLEYHNMIMRFLFNEDFLSFAKRQKDISSFYERIVRELIYKIEEYELPFVVLAINFCEQILSQGINNAYILEALNSLYLRTGLIQKYMQNNNYNKILYPVFINVSEQSIKQLVNTGLFETDSNIADLKNLLPITIFNKKTLREVDQISGPAISIIGEDKNYVRNNILLISNLDNCYADIVTYIQDQCYLYSNGLFGYQINHDIYNDAFSKLQNEYNKIIQENSDLHNQLNIIYGSRSWKLMQKIRHRR